MHLRAQHRIDGYNAVMCIIFWRADMQGKRWFVALLMLLCHAIAVAQEYPSRAVRMVVGFPPGGANDILSRLVGAKLQERLGQAFITDNKPGANAMIAAEYVARAAPDGYTLLVGASGAMAFNPGLYDKLSYDPIKDFAPVTMVGAFPLFLAIHPSVEANSVRELIALTRARPGHLTYGTGSTPFQLAVELFKSRHQLDIRHIPYKGSAPSVNALLGGEVSMTILDSPPLVPHIRAGKLRGLAVTAARRAAVLPDVPTMAEAGMPDFEVALWTSLFAPAGTSPVIIKKLQTEIARLLQAPDIRERLALLGIEASGMSADELALVLRQDIERWTRVARSTGIRFTP